MIVYGHFPWRLLYLPLAAAIVAGIAYVTFTDGWERPIPQGLDWFAAAFTAWWAFLIVRSGVIPSSIGPATYREDSPVVFWCVVGAMALISLFFFVVAVNGGANYRDQTARGHELVPLTGAGCEQPGPLSA